MFCTNCGKELIGDEQFCVNCGAPIETNMEKTEDIGVEIEKSTRKNKAWIFIVPGVILLVILSIAAWFLISTKDNKNEKVKNDKEREEHLQEIAELEPLYSDIEIPSIDLRVQNVTPAQKQQGVEWDSTLFYWLEDIDQTSNEDGYLSRCYVNKTLMKDVRDDRLIEYEIYRDPETDEIYKIVSIKMTDDELDLMDYYYQNGIPNFMFFRTDSVYTPTYATPSKIGERFYFANDMMARWRIIREPNVIGEYVLDSSENVNYSQSNYFEETEELQKTYDEEEAERLNEAYNTYNAIMEQKSIGILNGTVKDTTGAPMANRVIDIMRTEDNVLLYRTETDENGFFELTTWLDDEECHMVVLGDMEYKDSVVYDVRLDMSQAKRSYPNIILYKESENEYPVHINLFSAEDMRTEENGTMVRNELKGATAIVRAGTGAYTGDEIMTVKADEGTSVTANLPSGTYTVQIDAAGYTSTYIEVIVAEQETTVESYMLPEVPENTYGVVLVWDDPAVDLDLTLFTPYQSTDGDMAHVGGNTLSDTHGNRLLSDNTAGCEVLYINAAEYGNYKLYVNDYTNSVKGNYTADTLTNMSIRIYIYDANGFVTEYSRPLGQNGVVWEVVEISGKQFTPSGRIYNRLDGKKWWTANKAEFNWENCTNLQSVLIDLVYYTGIDDYHNDAERMMETANNICQGDEESIFSFWDAHKPPVEEYIFKDYSAFDYDINYGLTKDQMEYAAYSLTGKNLSFDNLDANLYGDGTGIGFEYFSSAGDYNDLLNVETEYVGEDTWRIQADVWYYFDDEPGKKVADISFLIARNPGSCYDGFRVVGVESIELVGRLLETREYSIVYEEWSSSDDENVFLLNKELYEYDNAGNIVTGIRYYENGSIVDWTEYDYFENIVTGIRYKGDGSIEERTEYEYDNAGNIVTKIRYNGDGSIILKYEYEYDNAGNLLHEYIYDDNGLQHWRDYTYPKDGIVHGVASTCCDDCHYDEYYYYDDNDNLRFHVQFCDVSMEIIEYIYSSTGESILGTPEGDRMLDEINYINYIQYIH